MNVNYVDEKQKWLCVFKSSSLFEANLLKSFLESKGIIVNIYTSASALHDYLHDKSQLIRIFIPAEDFERGQYYTHRIMHIQRIRTESKL